MENRRNKKIIWRTPFANATQAMWTTLIHTSYADSSHTNGTTTNDAVLAHLLPHTQNQIKPGVDCIPKCIQVQRLESQIMAPAVPSQKAYPHHPLPSTTPDDDEQSSPFTTVPSNPKVLHGNNPKTQNKLLFANARITSGLSDGFFIN
jgi:hypothetical protein